MKVFLSFFFSYLLLSFLVLTLNGCKTPLHKAPFFKKKDFILKDFSQGRWEGSLFVKKGKKSHYFKIYFQAIKNKKLRLDIVTKLYMPLLSMALNEEYLQYLFIQEKKFYYGRKDAVQNLKPFLSLPLDPKLLFPLLFDKGIQSSGWNCKESEKKSHFVACKNLNLNLVVELEIFSSGGRTIFIRSIPQDQDMNRKKRHKSQNGSSHSMKESLREDSKAFLDQGKRIKNLSLKLNLTHFYPKVKQKKEDLFHITPPVSYQKIRITP